MVSYENVLIEHMSVTTSLQSNCDLIFLAPLPLDVLKDDGILINTMLLGWCSRNSDVVGEGQI